MNNGTEKQARLGALLKALRGGMATTMTGAKKALPYAATAGAAGGIGHQVGYGSGHETGYGKGSAEGGNNAMRNLYKGLYDLMQQGANSKTDLSPLIESPEARLLKAGAAKRIRIKLARHVVNLNSINQELASYNVASLVKAAATQSSKEMRIKYAALKVQQAIEKQAVLGALSKLVGLGIGGVKGAYKGLQGLGGIAVSGARAAQPHLQQGLQAAGKGMADTIKANPMRGAAGMGVAGLGAGLAAPTITGALNSNVVQPVVGAGRSMYNTAQNVGTRLGNASHALFGPMAQPQPAQMPPIRPVGMPQQRTM